MRIAIYLILFLLPIRLTSAQDLASKTEALRGYWRFDEGSGATTADLSTNGFTGMLESASWVTDDPDRGTVLEFDGDAWIATGESVAELGDDDFTYSAWIKTEEPGSGIISKQSDDEDWTEAEKKFYVSPGEDGDDGGGAESGGLSMVGWGGDWVAAGADAPNVADGEWHHVALTFSRDDVGAEPGKIYVDGEEVPSYANQGFNGLADNPDDQVYIGRTPGGEGVVNFIGQIDEVAIWQTVLTAEDIALLAAGASAIPAAEGDNDGDFLPDEWEQANFGNLSATAVGDPDEDGLNNLRELELDTDPNKADTDDDGANDGDEVAFRTDPKNPNDTPAPNTVLYTGSGEAWDTSEAWSDGNPPSASNHYVVARGELLSSEGPSPVFPGDSLTLLEGGTLSLGHAKGTAAEIGDLQWNGGSLASEDEHRALSGKVTVGADSIVALGSDDDLFEIRGQLSGNGTITIQQEFAENPGDRGAVWLSGTNNVFSGNWIVQGGVLRAITPGSLGMGDVTLANGTLDLDYNLFARESVLRLDNENIRVVLDQDIAFAEVFFGNFAVPAGTYEWVDLANDLDAEEQFIDGGGRLIVGGEDADADGLLDSWEREVFGDLSKDGTDDDDSDGLEASAEFAAGSNPTKEDSDDDGLSDGQEVSEANSDPGKADTDDDGLSDQAEFEIHETNPRLADSDGDSLTDREEVETHLTNPNESDTDGDGFSDGTEIAANSNPNNAEDEPKGLDYQRETLVAYFPFSEGSGNVTEGFSDQKIIGELVDTEWVADPERGAVLEFGGEAWVATNSEIGQFGEGDFTYTAWIKTDEPGGVIVSKQNDDNLWAEAEKKFYVSPGPPDEAGIEGNIAMVGWGADWVAADGAPVDDGEWHHVALTWQFEGEEEMPGKIYIDGAEVAQYADNSFNGLADNEGDLVFIGRTPGGEGTSHFVGRIDDVALWNSALPAGDIALLAAGIDAVTIEGESDTDKDGLLDFWETQFFGSLAETSESDPDEDDLSNEEELLAGTDPTKADTDADGLTDGDEVHEFETKPNKADSDGDGLTDFEEVDEYETDPLEPDTDGDGVDDRMEIAAETDPDDPNVFPVGLARVLGDLRGYWNFNEAAGTTVADGSANGHDGTLMGAQWAADEGDRSSVLEFDGESWVGFDEFVAELGNSDFTYSAWVKTQEPGGVIVSKQNDNEEWEEAEKKFYISPGIDGGDEVEGIQPGNVSTAGWGTDWIAAGPDTPNVADGEWHHLALTFDLDAVDDDPGRIYVDGEEVEEYAAQGYNGLADNSTDSLYIGRTPGGEGTSNFLGQIDEVAIWNAVLSPSEIGALADGATPFDGGVFEATPPVGHWPFDEGEGTTTEDVSDGGHDGTLVNAEWVDDSDRGAVLSFSGDAWVATGHGITELGDADFTYSAWIKTDQAGVAIVSKQSDDDEWEEAEKKFYISPGDEEGPEGEPLDEGGSPAGALSMVGWGADWVAAGESEANDGEWHHVALTFRRDLVESDPGRIYVDGEEIGEYANQGFNGLADNPGDLVYIGRTPGGESTANFVGLIDDVAIWDRALTADEIRALAEPGDSGELTPLELAGYWPFEEGTGDTTVDVSSGGHDGALVGAQWSQDPDRGAVLAFDGEAWVATNNGIAELGSDSFSYSAWIKTGQAGVAIVSKQSDDDEWEEAEKKFYISPGDDEGPEGEPLDEGGAPVGALSMVGWGADWVSAGEPIVTDNEWHHVVLTVDHRFIEDDPGRIYVDGIEVGSYANQGFNGLADNEEDLVYIGRTPGGESTENYVGMIDDVSIWQGVLSPAQVAQLAAGTNPADIPTDGPLRGAGFVIEDVVRTEAGTVSLNWPTEPGVRYAVEYSTTLEGDWQTVATIDGDGDMMNFVDDETARIDADQGYYRIAVLE